jgi:outer membrane protein TolC
MCRLSRTTPRLIAVSRCALILALAASSTPAQEKPEAPKPQSPPSARNSQTPSPHDPLQLSLAQALVLARANSTIYQAALTEAGSTHEDRTQARDALLPQVAYNNQYLYTQPNQLGAVRYISNNAVHEYVSQGNVHEAIDVAAVATYRKVTAAAALAKAKAEIASRGLVVTVVQSYFAVLAAQNKLEAAERAAAEGDRFVELTRQLEHGGEVAHSDSIKAELQAQDRRRQFQEAQLTLLRSRLDLAVLLFPNFQDNFVLTENLAASAPLPTLEEIQRQAALDNPDLRAALESVRMTDHGVTATRAEYLPSLGLDYFYGIDAPQFAANSVINGQKVSNLGYSALASLNFPVWNWGATRSRIHQAQLQQKQAKLELSFAQRKLIAEIRSLYAETETSLNELAGLQRSAELAAESQRLTTLRYKGGEATVLEVVDSQTANVQAANNYQDGAVRYRVALANLETLTGVLTTP